MLSIAGGAILSWTANRRMAVALAVLCWAFAGQAMAQQPQPPEDPEDEKQIGLWLDQGVSTGLSPGKSLEMEVHERFDEGPQISSNIFFKAALLFVCGRGSLCYRVIGTNVFLGIPLSLTKIVSC
jgi:hypothetical protein